MMDPFRLPSLRASALALLAAALSACDGDSVVGGNLDAGIDLVVDAPSPDVAQDLAPDVSSMDAMDVVAPMDAADVVTPDATDAPPPDTAPARCTTSADCAGNA